MAEDPDDIDNEDNPELTAADFERARPSSEVFPELYEAWNKLGRPPVVTIDSHLKAPRDRAMA